MSFKRVMMLTFHYVRKVIQDMITRINLLYYYENDAQLENILTDINGKDGLMSSVTGLTYPTFLLTSNCIKDGGLTMPIPVTYPNLTFLQTSLSTKVNSAGNIVLNGEQNLLTSSANFGTTAQSIPVLAGDYNLSFYAAVGSSISASGAYVGNLAGTGISNRVTSSFTVAAPGTLTLTKTGTISNAQLTNTTTAQQYMPTTTRLAIPSYDYTFLNTPGLLLEPDRINLLTGSSTLSTQTVVLPLTGSNRAYMLSFYGTGNIQLSSATSNTVTYNTYSGNDQISSNAINLFTTPQTLSGIGATSRVFATIQNPSSGSLVLTVTGIVTNAQLEYYTNTSPIPLRPTSYIPTTTIPVTRTQSRIQVANSTTLGYTNPIFTFYIEFYQKYWNQSVIVSFVNGTNTFSIPQFRLRQSSKVYIDPTNGAAQINTNDIFNGSNKTVFTLNTITNKIKIWQNGALVGEFTPTVAFLPINSFSFDQHTDSTIYRAVAFWSGSLPDAQCLKLSTF